VGPDEIRCRFASQIPEFRFIGVTAEGEWAGLAESIAWLGSLTHLTVTDSTLCSIRAKGELGPSLTR